jgi:hypothetical protein
MSHECRWRDLKIEQSECIGNGYLGALEGQSRPEGVRPSRDPATDNLTRNAIIGRAFQHAPIYQQHMAASTPLTASDIDAYLATADDFAFELRCFREIKKFPTLSVMHGGSYPDPVTGKSRQFDFRVWLSVPSLRISFAIEAKNLKPYAPLLVSRVPRPAEEALHDVLVRNDPTGQQIVYTPGQPPMPLYPSKTVTRHAPYSPYGVGEPVGKTIALIKQTSPGSYQGIDAEVYERYAQALGSAYELIEQASVSLGRFEVVDGKPVPPLPCFVLPILVVPDDTLWVVDYQADGSTVGPPVQVLECTFYLGHSPTKEYQTFTYTISHLHFVTLTGLGALLSRFIVNANFLDLLRPPSSINP